MAEPGSGQKQARNSESTRQAILNAAEQVFAENGFDGARIEVIAAASSYNQSLIFRYFGDKLGLYAEVLKRIDRQADQLQAQLLGPLLADNSILSDARRFRAFLTTAVGAFFDFMVENPAFMRMMLWEHAEGWRTYTKVTSIFEIEGLEQLETLFSEASKAGLLRSNGDPLVLFLLAEQICWVFPTSIPFYQIVLPGRDFSSTPALANLRERVISFVVSGILVDG